MTRVPSHHPYGSFRRRIRMVNTDAHTAVAALEDDFHHFEVTVDHDTETVTAIAARAIRWPWTTCPDAGAPLQILVGMTLSPSWLAVGDVADAKLQCTHQFDLAGLAVAHATRDELTRQYDLEVPFGAQAGGPKRVRLARDGEERLVWTLDGRACVDPEPYASAPWRGGFLKWAEATFPADDAEAATVLRRACDISLGRGIDLEAYASGTDLGPTAQGICYTFQPDVVVTARRQLGTIRNFDGHVDEMLADSPRPPTDTMATG